MIDALRPPPAATGYGVKRQPGTGIPARFLPEVLGRKARLDIPADTVLTEDLLS